MTGNSLEQNHAVPIINKNKDADDHGNLYTMVGWSVVAVCCCNFVESMLHPVFRSRPRSNGGVWISDLRVSKLKLPQS